MEVNERTSIGQIRQIAELLLDGAVELARTGLLVDRTTKTPKEMEAGKGNKAGETTEHICLADQLAEIRRLYDFLDEHEDVEEESWSVDLPPWLVQRALQVCESYDTSRSPAKQRSIADCGADTEDSPDR